MNKNQIQLDVLINEKPVKQYSHNGKTFVEAKLGQEYKIKIKNNSSERILAIVSVDSSNVIDGKTATTNGAGYVIQGYSSYEIAGFRVSNDKVNAFKFSRKENSYAAKNEDNPDGIVNCGVVGVYLFSEKPSFTHVTEQWKQWNKKSPPPYYPPFKPSYPIDHTEPIWMVTEDSFTKCQGLGASNAIDNTLRCFSMSADLNNFDAGTEFSEKEIVDKVQDTEFIKEKDLGVLEIFYASREALEVMGVKINKEPEISFPSSFPKNFCKPPKK